MVVGKERDQHIEIGDEVHRLKGTPGLGNLLSLDTGLRLLAQPLGFAGLSINETGHPLAAALSCGWFDQAQSVLEHAARGSLAESEPEGNTFLNLVRLMGDRFQMAPENIEHQPRIAGSLKLGEVRVRRKSFRA